jgi:hypothetical protein
MMMNPYFIIFLCFLHYVRKTTMNTNLSLSFGINEQNIIIVNLFFLVPAKEDDEPPIGCHLLKFCSLIPKNNDKLTSLLFFFYFDCVCPKKTMTNRHLLSFFIVCFCAPRKDDDKLALLVIFFVLFLCTLKKRRRQVSAYHLFFVFFLCT